MNFIDIKRSCLFIALFLSGVSFTKNTGYLAVFDELTSENSVFNESEELASRLGLHIKKYSLAGSKDSSIDAYLASSHSATLFILSPEFFLADSGSLLKKRLLMAIKHSSSIVGSVTLLAMPSLPGQKSPLIVGTLLRSLFAALDIENIAKSWIDDSYQSKKLDTALLNFLSAGTPARELEYHTTLRSPKGLQPSDLLNAHGFLGEDAFFSMPSLSNDEIKALTKVSSIVPFGFCYAQPKKKKTIIFASSEVLFAGSVGESFMVYPMNRSLQKRFYQAVSFFWQDVALLIKKGDELLQGASGFPISHKKYTQPGFSDSAQPKDGKVVKTAWMELCSFEEPEGLTHDERELKKSAQEELVESLILAGLDTLWISLSPQMVYGIKAKNPDKKELFESAFIRFSKKLKKTAAKFKKKMPKILIGFEIVNNIYDDKLPLSPMVDLYGNRYHDVPSLIDESFWKDELTDPLKRFMSFYHKNKLSKEVEISGIVIDLELYGRKNASEFRPLMLGDSALIKSYSDDKKYSKESVQDSLERMIIDGKIKNVLKTAKDRAAHCARFVKKIVSGLIHDGAIACYLPSVNANWFTTSFCHEFVTAGSLQLFTFNSCFDRIRSHAEVAFGCKIFHSSVLMLSKITESSYAMFLSEALKGNDGCWFNRWSRFAESADKKAWHAVEQPQIFGKSPRREFYEFVSKH